MLPLRLVLDTNVVVSAALKPESLQRTMLLLATSKPARLYASEPILEEYEEVLSRPELGIRRGLRLQLMQWIRNSAHLVRPTRSLSITSDPDDNMFLECCDHARADFLVTGNRKHFPTFWKSTKVISARDFVDIVAPSIPSRESIANSSPDFVPIGKTCIRRVSPGTNWRNVTSLFKVLPCRWVAGRGPGLAENEG